MSTFEVNVTLKITGDKELDRVFRKLTPSLQRGVIRKGVRAGGSALIKQIRQNISRVVGKDSQAIIDRRAKRRVPTGLLKKSIGQRAWSRPKRGIIGTVVGQRYNMGRHAHLIEFGHDVYSHGRKTPYRVKPRPFQRPAMRQARGAILAAQKTKLQQALRKKRLT